MRRENDRKCRYVWFGAVGVEPCDRFATVSQDVTVLTVYRKGSGVASGVGL